MNLIEMPKEIMDWFNLPNPSYYEVFEDKDIVCVIPVKEGKPIKVVFTNE